MLTWPRHATGSKIERSHVENFPQQLQATVSTCVCEESCHEKKHFRSFFVRLYPPYVHIIYCYSYKPKTYPKQSRNLRGLFLVFRATYLVGVSQLLQDEKDPFSPMSARKRTLRVSVCLLASSSIRDYRAVGDAERCRIRIPLIVVFFLLCFCCTSVEHSS